MKTLLTFLLATILFTVACKKETMPDNNMNVEISNGDLLVEINPLGAELQSIYSTRSKREYLWHGDPEFWDRRAIIMFPVVVRFRGNQFDYKGKRYEMPVVGLARDAQFEIIEQADTTASFLFRSNAETRKHYPFDFEFTATYQLQGNTIINEFSVKNTGKETMYYALAGHPGFTFSHSGTTNRGDFELQFPASITVERHLLDEGVMQAEMVPLLKNERTLAFDDARVPDHGMVITNMSARTIGIGLRNQPPFVTVDLGDFPNTNMWSPTDKPFACIEPLVGHHDLHDSPMDIEKKAYLSSLDPGVSKSYQFTIEIHPEAPTL